MNLTDSTTGVTTVVPGSTSLTPGTPADGESEFQPFGEDGITFFDFLDIINPLQHIPIISTIYREITGDTIDHVPRIAGGALFGGPIGAGVAAANVVMSETTGKDLGEHVVAMFTDEEAPDGTNDDVAVAKNEDFTAGRGAAVGPPPDWPTNGLIPAAVRVEDLPLPAAMASLTAPAPAPIAQSAPIPAWAQTAAATGEDVVTVWARMETAIAGTITEPHPQSQMAAVSPAPPSVPGSLLARTTIAPEKGAPDSSTFLALFETQPPARDIPAAAEMAPPKPAKLPEQAPPGAVAPLGGWFPEVMLSALVKYQDTAKLAARTPPALTPSSN